MKQDAPAPAAIPRKRRQLERAPDTWLAEWAARDTLSPSETTRVSAERERRKALRRVDSRVVGIIWGSEGMTPIQREKAFECAHALSPTKILRFEDPEQIVRESDVIVAAPRELTPPKQVAVRDRSPVWRWVDRAKHRRIPVKIIMPDGKEGAL